LSFFSRLGNDIKKDAFGSLRYKSNLFFSGRLIVDIFDLSKNLIKLNSYEFDDMVTHFFPNNLKIMNEISTKLENNNLILKIALTLKIFPHTL
jgi:DNA polymerase elongation subunit (family B)